MAGEELCSPLWTRGILAMGDKLAMKVGDKMEKQVEQRSRCTERRDHTVSPGVNWPALTSPTTTIGPTLRIKRPCMLAPQPRAISSDYD